MIKSDEQKLPSPKVAEFHFDDWVIRTVKGHIMGSKCETQEVCAGAQDADRMCSLCRYEKSLKLPSLPDMVFASNILRVMHRNGGCIEFSALDALHCVSDQAESVEVAHAKVWKEARSDCEFAKKIVKPYDWTFTTNYRGTLRGRMECEETDERIDLNMLKVKEEIKFYDEVYLYEDELDDNGSTKCVVKVRAMPSGFFIVFRHYLRVDHVIIRVNDTRLYHPKGTDYILRESSTREAPMEQLKIDSETYKNPDLVWQYLPLSHETVDKLLPAV